MTAIGFIGLGVMGRPMALNLLRAGHQLTVFNRSRPVVDELAAAGTQAADSIADCAQRSDVVITMLPDSPDVLAVCDELIPAARAGALLIDMSTIAPRVAQELAARARARGVAMLDAPVSGGDVGARDGTLSIMVGGEAGDVDRARPILDVLGKTIVHVGPAGAGQVVKACNQVVVAMSIQAVAEALVLGSKIGVEPGVILDVLSGGLAANKVMEVRRRNMLEHDFTPGFRTRLHAKDLAIALDAARTNGVSLPGTALTAQLFSSLVAHGHGDDDHSALLAAIEQLAAHRIGSAHTTGVT
jgi:2-hydroxy-3-oxopropionate reductase